MTGGLAWGLGLVAIIMQILFFFFFFQVQSQDPAAGSHNGTQGQQHTLVPQAFE